MVKRLKKRYSERLFKIRRFFYRRPQMSYVLLCTKAVVLRVFVILAILLWSGCIGVGIVGILNKILKDAWLLPMKWWVCLPFGVLFAAGLIGGLVIFVAGLQLCGEHITETRRKIKRKHSYFRYDVEYEIEDRAADQRRRDREIERAKLAAPKWEV